MVVDDENVEIFQYKDRYYIYVEEVTIKNDQTREWEEGVAYCLHENSAENQKELDMIFVRSAKEFYEKFEKVTAMN